MSKMNIIGTEPTTHLSTYTMKSSEYFDDKDEIHDDFDQNIHEYMHHINNCSNRTQAIFLRTNALKYIDQWRLQRLEQLDQRVRRAGQLVLNAFDDYQSKKRYNPCSHRFKQSSQNTASVITSITTIPIRAKAQSIGSIEDLSSPITMNLLHNTDGQLKRTKQNSEMSINQSKSSSFKISSSIMNTKLSLSSVDFGRDFTFETLAHLPSPSNDMAMIVCENETLIYSQNSNELVIVSLKNPKHLAITQLDKNSMIRDLCYVDWLFKALVITDKGIYLLDYRTTKYDIIDSNTGSTCGAIDNRCCISYLIQQSTLYKYDKNSLLTRQADQYPIADGYHPRRMALDNKTNHYLALLVRTNDEKNYILVYSTLSLCNGYFYKIVIDDQIERQWICSNGIQGWLVQGTYPNSCFDLNINGLNSVRIFNCNEIRNIIPMNEHERFIVRTNTEIFVLIKHSFVESF